MGSLMKYSFLLLVFFVGGCWWASENKGEISHKTEFIRRDVLALDIFRQEDSLIDSVLKHFPLSVYFISYYNTSERTPILNIKSGVYQRYIMYVKAPLNLDEGGNILSRGEAIFYVTEITKVELVSENRVSSSHGGLNARFTEAEWWNACDSHHVFKKLGIDLMSNTPVAGFELLFRK
jgi:hypothetical protein